MSNFSATEIKKLQEDITAALAEVSKKNGVSIDFGTIRYDPNEYRCKMTVTKKNNVSPMKEDEHCIDPKFIKGLSRFFGIKFGDKVKIKNRVATIVGGRPRSELNVIVKFDDGVMRAYKYEYILSLIEGDE